MQIFIKNQNIFQKIRIQKEQKYYIRLSQEDSDNGEDKQESNSITSQKHH